MAKMKIGEATVNNGKADTSYTIPGDAATGAHTLSAAFIQNDTYMRGEGNTILNIRIKTAITVNDVVASHGENATFTAVVTHTGSSNVPAGAGQVQFQLAGDNIGDPVTIGDNGTATLQYIIPDGAVDESSITASFLQNETYAGSNSSAATLNIRKATNVSVENIYANKGEKVTLHANITDADAQNVTTGDCVVLVDHTQVATGTVENGKLTTSFTLNTKLATGTHTLTVNYTQNDDYEAATGTATLMIRKPTILTPVNVSGNAGTPQDTIPVTVNVTDENKNAVQTGSVGITIGSEAEVIIAVNSNGEATTTYTIPSNAKGTIQFTARFIQDNNYQESTMATAGVITIRKGTTISMESINAIRGEVITLSATVKDEDNNNVTSGTVEFELE